MNALLVTSKALAASAISLDSLPHVSAGSSSNLVKTVLSIVLGVVAALSFLMVVIGGFRYILAQGDSQAVAKAKNTIIYALVGLALAITAQAIVAFVTIWIG